VKNEWLILSKDNLLNGDTDSNTDACGKLLDIMNQIEDGRGWRFTSEQADILAKLVDRLIEQVRADTKKRNKERKRLGTLFNR